VRTISYQNTDKNWLDEKIHYENPNLFSGKEFGLISQLHSSEAPTQKKECSVACHSSKKIFAMENALRKAYKYNLGICIPFEEYGIRDYRKT